MWLALLLLLALTGCSSRAPRSPGERFDAARAELRQQHYVAALKQVNAALAGAPAGSIWNYRLRLLRVEILLEQREFKQAREALDFDLPAGAGWTADRARYRLCQAILAQRDQKLDEALSRLDEAHALAAQADAIDTLGEIELRRSRVFIQNSNFVAADAVLQGLLDNPARWNNPYLQMKAKGNLGFSLMHADRYEEAITWFEESLKMALSLHAVDDELRSVLNRGWCYYRLGELDKAQQDFERCAEGFQKTGNREDGHRCLGNIATTMYGRHEYAAAAATYQRALDLSIKLDDRQSRADWLNNLANVAIETGDWDRAERLNNDSWALRKNDPASESYSIVNAAYIASGRKDFAKAEELFRSVIRADKSHVTVLDAHTGLAFAFASHGKEREAAAEYRNTDGMVERQRTAMNNYGDKLAYFSSLIAFYKEYVDYLMERGRVREALEIAESSRARALADRLGGSRIAGRAGGADRFERLAAGPSTVLMSYWVGPKTSYLWVVTGGAVRSITLPSEARIRAMVEAYDAVLQNAADPLATQSAAGRQLYETLVAPARAWLPKDPRIVLVPDGPLYALNFETLPVFDGTPHYWIEDVTLSIAPSLGLLSPGDIAPGDSRRSLLLVGNPVSPVPQYPALQFAAQEMTAVRTNLAASRLKVLDGPSAEKDAFIKAAREGYDYIHFVAHAVANPSEPLESAVILSRHGTDYKLLARDVIKLRFNTELVTISACRSAGARIYGGEGLVGLAWGFLQAGARNVIAGLWDVNDRSTAELVDRLYAGIARGLDPAGALRAAKLNLVRSTGAFHKPYYWGPFEVFTRQSGGTARRGSPRVRSTQAASKPKP